MKVNLISLALCLPQLLVTAVLYSTTEASQSPTETPTTFLGLRLSPTTPETLKPLVSTTETQPRWTKGMFTTQKVTTASLALVKDSGVTTKGDLVRRGISPYAVTAGNNINGHATAGGSKMETEIYIPHGSLPDGERTSSSSTNKHITLPGEARATSHDSSTTDKARELITPNATEMWPTDNGNYTRVATTFLDEPHKDQQTATNKGLQSSATPSGNYYREKSDFFTSTSSSRTTASSESRQSRFDSVIATTNSPTYTATLPSAHEHMKNKAANLKTQREDTSQAVVNRVTAMASTANALRHGTNNVINYNVDERRNRNTSRTSKDLNQTALSSNETSLSGQGKGLSNTTALDHTARPECGEADEMPASLQHTPSGLVCFVILWALAVTASVFLGISIFLWVRISVQKEEKRFREGEGGRERASGINLENLWTDQTTSVEERVEFWYANGTTLGHNQRGRESQRREEKVKECESLWLQPKVTLEDITDFWYANGRTIPEEDQRLLETCV